MMTIKEDLKCIDRHVWAEVSGAMEHLYRKFGAAVLPPSVAQKLMPLKEIIPLDDENDLTLGIEISDNERKKQPTVKGEHYAREIGGHLHRKCLVGYPDTNIKPTKKND